MIDNLIIEASNVFDLDGEIVSREKYGHGHINDTYKIVCSTGIEYILQRINHHVFKSPDKLMENVVLVTEFLQKKVKTKREALSVVSTKQGDKFYVDIQGNHYRVYDFITDSICLQSASCPQDFYESAVGFGEFQNMLSDFPAEKLNETIKDFHNTPVRFENFKEAVNKDVVKRVESCQDLINRYLQREDVASTLMELMNKGELPLRVTHNDTKLNNVMLDENSKKPLCVIDLDTVMPGLVAFDFGDSIRFGASTASEDETDLSKITIDLSLFEMYARGFLSSCGKALTKKEIETLPVGAKLMTLECGVRFLTDHLDGDNYFKIHHENHNLERSKNQLKLVEDMEEKWQEMNDIITKIAKELELY